MMKLLLSLAFVICNLSFSAALLACATDNGAGDGVVSEGLMTVPNVPGQWTYISLSEGRVVGTCALSDTTAQRQWAQRTDWDLATCNGMLRTNGGDSGIGKGAAATTADAYDAADPLLPATYVNDRDTVEVW